jgi:hypothetical protein
MILPNQRIPGTQKQYHAFKRIPFPHSFTTANPPPQIHNNAEAHDRAPYGGALETTHKPAHPNPLPEQTTLKLRTCKFPVFPHTTTNNLLSRIPMPPKAYRQTEALHALNPDGRMQLRYKRGETTQPKPFDAPQLHACSHSLPKRTTLDTVCISTLYLDLVTDKLPQYCITDSS